MTWIVLMRNCTAFGPFYERGKAEALAKSKNGQALDLEPPWGHQWCCGEGCVCKNGDAIWFNGDRERPIVEGLFFDLTAAIEYREMEEKIDHLKSVDLGNELSDWQTQDLHRHRPFTMRSRRAGRAATVIRPHSLFEVKRSAAYQRRMGRRVARGGRRAMVWFTRWEVLRSMRPILRPEMLERLSEIVSEKLKW